MCCDEAPVNYTAYYHNSMSLFVSSYVTAMWQYLKFTFNVPSMKQVPVFTSTDLTINSFSLTMQCRLSCLQETA